MGRHWKIYSLAAVVLIVLLAGAVHNELLGPRIRAVPRPGADPFTLRFAVFNPAFFVTLKNVDMTCLPIRVEGHGKGGRAWEAKAKPFPLNMDIDLAPRMAYEYTCPVEVSTTDAPSHVEAKVAIRYTRFGRREQAMSGTLVWDSASRVWTLAGATDSTWRQPA